MELSKKEAPMVIEPFTYQHTTNGDDFGKEIKQLEPFALHVHKQAIKNSFHRVLWKPTRASYSTSTYHSMSKKKLPHTTYPILLL
jgi:hypothetical protein